MPEDLDDWLDQTERKSEIASLFFGPKARKTPTFLGRK